MKIIIGDKFISFINATGNISYSEIANNPGSFHGEFFIVGLGLSHEEISRLNQFSKDYHFTLYQPVLPAILADCSVTHNKLVHSISWFVLKIVFSFNKSPDNSVMHLRGF